MNEEISNTKLQQILRKKIAENPKDVVLMKSILYCGSKVIHQMAMTPAVYVLTDDADAKLFGTTSCKNTWVCPVCSARKMATYAAEIAVAIDALKQWKNQVACMITFTVPHTISMSCQETSEILFNTWKDFITHGNRCGKNKYYRRQNGQKILTEGATYIKDPFSQFCQHFNCSHRVRVGEYTWGKHGWHPHFHCLFWVDKNKLQEVKDWQETLNKRWYELALKQTIKIWNKLYPENKKNNCIRANIMYDKMDKKGSQGIYISVDKDGKVIEQKSSQYICGWGADKELTGNYQSKATNPEHFSPRQLLEKYQETHDEKWLDIFMEMARTTRLKTYRRVMFSTQSGIKKIIAEWKKTHRYIETLKKKALEKAANRGVWRVVYSFNEKQWSQIYWHPTNHNLIPEILARARLPDPAQQIEDLLRANEIDIYPQNDLKQAMFIENLFNETA
ncbi:MAG: hypothetical protein Q4D17_02130 [Planctomycetia bacterium]|nr:hypothetical protein [Planctomycetia bacterium]